MDELKDICCDVFPRIAASFKWFSTEDGTTLCMPYIEDPEKDLKWRVNHCPSCGKEIRSIFVAKEVLFPL